MRYAFTGPSAGHAGEVDVIVQTVADLPKVTEVITGGAAFVDTIVAVAAAELYPDARHRLVLPQAPYNEDVVLSVTTALGRDPIIEIVPGKGDRAACYRARNERMVSYLGDGGRLVAFVRSPSFYRSGEWMTVNIAKRGGVPVELVPLAPADALGGDKFAARTDRERYRLYVLRDGEPFLVATAPDAAGVGTALIERARDRWESNDYSYEPVGVLDGMAGHWVTGLWHRKEG